MAEVTPLTCEYRNTAYRDLTRALKILEKNDMPYVPEDSVSEQALIAAFQSICAVKNDHMGVYEFTKRVDGATHLVECLKANIRGDCLSLNLHERAQSEVLVSI